MAIKYALFENNLTSDPDDYMAIVQDQDSITIDEIIERMISRGSTVTKAEALSVLEEFEAAVAQGLQDGFSVNTPLFRIAPSISGVFSSDETFSKSKHYVRLNVTPGIRIDEIAELLDVEKVETSIPRPVISSFKDVASDTLNDTLTSGGVGDIKGSRLKVDPEDKGVFLIAADGSTTRAEVLVRNKPSNLIFMIPEGLAAGTYSLEVRAKIYRTSATRSGSISNLVIA